MGYYEKRDLEVCEFSKNICTLERERNETRWSVIYVEGVSIF